jgi:hypothetical protein
MKENWLAQAAVSLAPAIHTFSCLSATAAEATTLQQQQLQQICGSKRAKEKANTNAKAHALQLKENLEEANAKAHALHQKSAKAHALQPSENSKAGACQ